MPNNDDQLYAKKVDIVRYYSIWQKINKLYSEPENERQLSLRYVDNIICPVNAELDTLLRKVNDLHRKLEFTVENHDENFNFVYFRNENQRN